MFELHEVNLLLSDDQRGVLKELLLTDMRRSERDDSSASPWALSVAEVYTQVLNNERA